METVPEKYRGSELIGPFAKEEYFTLTYEGKKIPYVTAVYLKDTDGTEGYLVKLDDRMMFGPWTENDLLRVLPLLANAMAFSAGYPCFGVDEKRGKFNTTITGIYDKPTLTPIDGGKT